MLVQIRTLCFSEGTFTANEGQTRVYLVDDRILRSPRRYSTAIPVRSSNGIEGKAKARRRTSDR